MDPFRLAIATVPLALYVLLLAVVNFGRRPLVVRGVYDAVLLVFALSGFAVVGPLELFIPLATAAAAQFGYMVWSLLIAFYWLCALLLALLLRPRLVVYNISHDRLQEVLESTVAHLDHAARWTHNTAALPVLGIHFAVDTISFLNCVSISSVGRDQNLKGWRQFEAALKSSLGETEPHRKYAGVWLLIAAAAMLVATTFQMINDPHALAMGMQQILNP